MKKVIFLFFLLTTFSKPTYSMEKLTLEEIPDTSSLKKISEKSFTCTGKTSKGENIYFGIERLRDNEERIKYWRSYQRFVDEMVKTDRGILAGIASDIEGFKAANSWNFFQDVFKEGREEYNVKKYIGYEKPEFKEWLENIVNRVDLEKIKKIKKSIDLVATGTGGFSPYVQDYVAYISKSPILTERPLIEQMNKLSCTLKEFREFYGDIIICVGMTLYQDKRPFYQNRGIFRNPLGFLEGELSNVSVLLHGFTALACKEIDPSLKYLMVLPRPFMGGLLKHAFPEKRDLCIGEENVRVVLKEAGYEDNYSFFSNGMGEEPYLILLDSLKEKIKCNIEKKKDSKPLTDIIEDNNSIQLENQNDVKKSLITEDLKKNNH